MILSWIEPPALGDNWRQSFNSKACARTQRDYTVCCCSGLGRRLTTRWCWAQCSTSGPESPWRLNTFLPTSTLTLLRVIGDSKLPLSYECAGGCSFFFHPSALWSISHTQTNTRTQFVSEPLHRLPTQILIITLTRVNVLPCDWSLQPRG